jgi:hypothetical protein
MILEALEMPASEIFERFAAWLETNPSHDITQTQRGFIGSLFEEQGASMMGSIAADIINYFGYSAELIEDQSMEPHSEDQPSRRVTFNHDPVDLLAQMEAGMLSLEELALALPQKACDAVLSVTGDTIEIQVLRVP